MSSFQETVPPVATRRSLAVRAAEAVSGAAPAVTAAATGSLLVGGTAAARGGYFPQMWGWPAVGLLSLATVALVGGGTPRLRRREWLFVGGLALLVAWVGASAAWSASQPRTVLELERDLVYVGATLAVLLVVRRRCLPQLLGGLLGAVTVVAAYALATRLFPERLGTVNLLAGYRLARPLGYWNALGSLTAIGALLAVGFAARGRSPAGRAVASAAPAVLLPVLYFTYGRGAMIAFGVGLVVLVAVDRARLQLLAAGLASLAPAAVAVGLAARSSALTTRAAPLADATRQGHRLAVLVLLLAAGGAIASLLLTFLFRRVTAPPAARLAFVLALGAATAAALGLAFDRYGDPARIAHRAYASFTGPPAPRAPGASLNTRLRSLSNNGRIELWRVAWREARAHPLAGSGAGTFELAWARERATSMKVRDAHSLYVETLAELGPVGLLLLTAALAAPFLGVARARAHPLGSTAVAGYAAYLLHAAADWDWEMPAVTGAGLLCGAAVLVASRRGRHPPFGARAQLALAAATLPLIAFALIGLVGNRALADAKAAAAAGEWQRSEARARAAVRWAPWSSEALDTLGNAQYALGRREDAYRTLLRAAGKDPESWSVWYDAGDAAPTRARALAAYERAARLDPLNPNIAMLRTLHVLPARRTP